jgi:hypothetical protein
MENGLCHFAKCWVSILEAFDHSEIVVRVEGCDKTHFFFIFFAQPNLMVVEEV